jgi:uncharacterized membrane protein (DUF485 family)
MKQSSNTEMDELFKHIQQVIIAPNVEEKIACAILHRKQNAVSIKTMLAFAVVLVVLIAVQIQVLISNSNGKSVNIGNVLSSNQSNLLYND